jgi:hypothetical protein
MLLLEFREEMLLSCSHDNLEGWRSAIENYDRKMPSFNSGRSTHFVVDIGNVHYEQDVVSEIISHDTPQDISADVIPRMS